jgi:signal peptidase
MPANAYCDRKKMIEEISVSPVNGSREVVSEGPSWRAKSRGESMYPLIKNGDTLLIEPMKAEEVNPGDIVIYRVPSGSFIAHRFIKRNSSGSLITNGDSMRQYDKLVAEEQVFGKVVQIERNSRVLKLEGRLSKLNTRLITLLAQYRIPLQITIKKSLGRIQWLTGLKQTL